MRAWGLVAAACLTASSARSEDLVLALSAQEITIASNFAGGDLTVFGIVKNAPAGGGPYDLIITTTGPAETLAVREKARVAGLWITRSTTDFPYAPTFLSVLSTRPPEESGAGAPPPSERSGLLGHVPGGVSAAAAALIRIQERRGLWLQDDRGVAFLDPSLFRATVRLPPNVPIGAFEVEARLYSGGSVVARSTVSFRVAKAGFEAGVADVAERLRLGYGLAVAALALLFGWAASAMFRRD
ncbi:TIGR02186 family protein [Hansschlegelia plantiphila]|uniref:TIGR02186 family protein n=1 Tax=Hansschlegelia plantiphila TaxID=374655 RepID=A0A9W6MXE8_9HYPH|nr:TIGR02186 family protein [Hansschlegelia plantiphila]GLK69822.1 hypothetical protein GCM10008179_34600 [Hansschlegelia plantiphila]